MKDIKPSISFFGATDPGRIRSNNEDTFIAQKIWGGTHLLLAAIDGIGGYEGGEVAAEIARHVITGMVSGGSDSDCLTLLKSAVTEANNEIVRQKEADPRRGNMGCVISSVIVDLVEMRLYMVHVGDSRFYVYTKQDGLRKLSHDHSLVGYREEIGLLTEQQAMMHPQRNIIDRSLGETLHTPDDANFLDSGIFPILSSTQLLLCSDGLSDMLFSSQIASVLKEDLPVEDEVIRLISMANDAGGKDNITAVVAEISLPSADNHREASASVASDYFQELASEEPAHTVETTSENKGSGSLRRAYIMVITIATSFIAGGTAGYFIGRYTTQTEAANTPVETPVPVDSIIAPVNEPVDSIADPYKVGELEADSVNKAYKAQTTDTVANTQP